MYVDIELEDLYKFLPKTITQIYGPAASGKTNLCLIATVKTALAGKHVIFIDSEGSFSVERVKQLAAKDFNKVMKHLILAEPATFDEQKVAINKIEEILTKCSVGLIVVDSLVSLYRLEVGESADPYAINRELGKQLAALLKISKRYKIPVVVTNQVYSSFERGTQTNNIIPVGRDILKYWTKIIIELSAKGNIRIARLVRHKFKPENKKLMFVITDNGITPAKEAIRNN